MRRCACFQKKTNDRVLKLYYPLCRGYVPTALSAFKGNSPSQNLLCPTGRRGRNKRWKLRGKILFDSISKLKTKFSRLRLMGWNVQSTVKCHIAYLSHTAGSWMFGLERCEQASPVGYLVFRAPGKELVSKLDRKSRGHFIKSNIRKLLLFFICIICTRYTKHVLSRTAPLIQTSPSRCLRLAVQLDPRH